MSEEAQTEFEKRQANMQAAISVMMELATALGGAGNFDAAGRAAMGAQAIRLCFAWYQEAQAGLMDVTVKTTKE